MNTERELIQQLRDEVVDADNELTDPHADTYGPGH